MPDDYLDGDPRADEDRFLFTDLTPFVQGAQQEFALLVELIESGRRGEALSVARQSCNRAEMLLEKLEAQRLPAVDVERSPDVADRTRRLYRSGGHE